MLRWHRLGRIATPVAAFTAGYLMFPNDWKKGKWKYRQLTHMNPEVEAKIAGSDLYKQLAGNPAIEMRRASDTFPAQHRLNHVGLGILSGPHLFEIDPIVFVNEARGELTAFYHLGRRLVSADGRIHNGVTATILDEGLCMCGFPKLPSKKGVTGQLSIDFKNQAPPESTVVLRASVKEIKGRKVVIDGVLLTFPFDGLAEMEIAHGRCVLVEPKWFKYLLWLQI